MENHSLYNDCDGKTVAVFAFLSGIDTEDAPKRAVVVKEALGLAQAGRLDAALYHVGYVNRLTPLDLNFDTQGHRIRQEARR